MSRTLLRSKKERFFGRSIGPTCSGLFCTYVFRELPILHIPTAYRIAARLPILPSLSPTFFAADLYTVPLAQDRREAPT